MSIVQLRTTYNEDVKKYSDVIKMARVICIFFMCYVHVHLFNSDLAQSDLYVQVSTIFRDALGRASVPLLSIIGGFLAVGYFSRRGYFNAVGNRFVSLIVPLLFWNVVGIALFTIMGTKLEIHINNLLPLTDNGFQHHLTFLRDLFAVALITPLLVLWIRWTNIWGTVVVVAACLAVDMSPFILRPSILLFYAVGVFIALHKFTPKYSKLPINMAVLCLGLLLFFPYPTSETMDTLVVRPLFAIAFWYSAVMLTKIAPISYIVNKVFEPAVFLLFLSHYIVARILAGVYANLPQYHTEQMYTLVWVMIPVVCFGVAIIGKLMLKLFPSVVSTIVSGK